MIKPFEQVNLHFNHVFKNASLCVDPLIRSPGEVWEIGVQRGPRPLCSFSTASMDKRAPLLPEWAQSRELDIPA
jgi:hypothetical protein